MTTTDYTPEQLRRAKDQLPHGARCPGPDYVARADRRTGRPMILCLGCHHHEHIDALVEQARPTSRKPEPALYACRAHYRPVTWRGTGCRECDREYRESRRQARRKRTEAS